MKTTIGALSLLTVLAIVGMLDVKELHKATMAAGGASAVLEAK